MRSVPERGFFGESSEDESVESEEGGKAGAAGVTVLLSKPMRSTPASTRCSRSSPVIVPKPPPTLVET